MRANGYGADLEFDGTTVTIHPGKAMARLAGTQRIAIPVEDVAGVDFRPANMLVNGELRLVLKDDDTHRLQAYGGRGPVPPDGSPELAAYAKQGLVTTESLVVHWRRKDQKDFEALHEQLVAAVG